jgi:predicted kinase
VVDADFARELEREVAKANAERDEARTIACDADAAYLMNGWSDQQYHPSLARQIATERGWNCFAEEPKR